MTTTREVRFNEYNTRRNLPAASGRKRGEANFLGAFARSLVAEVDPPCVYSRHFSVPGCGVADLLICQPSAGSSGSTDLADTMLFAFEAKLSDWKKGIQQAYRYKYYADLAVLVLPCQKAKAAIESEQLFTALGVALWTYDSTSGAIRRHVTPAQHGPLNSAKRRQALAKIRPRVANLCHGPE